MNSGSVGQSYYCFTESEGKVWMETRLELLTCSDGQEEGRGEVRGQRAGGRGRAELWRALEELGSGNNRC